MNSFRKSLLRGARFVKCIMNCCGFAGGVTEGYLDSCLVLDYQKKVEKAIDIYQLIVYNISRRTIN